MQEEMQENNGMTVRQFVDILKKSWVTILVSVLIVAVIFGSFLAIVKSVATDKSYKGTLYFADTSSNEARAAEISNLTSASNISKALEELGYPEEERAALTDDIRRAVSVAPVVPTNAQGSDSTYVPSTYVIVMTPVEGIGETQSLELLNALMNRFVTDYSKTSTDVASSIVMGMGDYSDYDYMHAVGELIDITTVNLQAVTDVVNRIATGNDSASHSKFAAVERRLTAELAKLRVLENTIAVNGVYREGAALDNSDYLAQQLVAAQATVDALNATVTSYETLIGSIASGGSQSGSQTSSGTIVIDNSALYTYLNNTYTKVLEEYQTASAKATVIESVQTTYTAAKTVFDGLEADQKTALRTSVEASIELYSESLDSLFADVSELFNQYNDYTGSTSNSIYVLAPASTISESILSNTVMLLVLLIVIVLTVFFAFMHGRRKYLQQLEMKAVETTIAAEATVAEEDAGKQTDVSEK